MKSSKAAAVIRAQVTLLLLSLCGLPLANVARAQEQGQVEGSQATASRWGKTAWWPTSGAPALDEYAGAESCSRCHAGIAATQRTTPMAHAASHASDSEILRRFTGLSFSDSRYSYSLSSLPGESKLTVKEEGRDRGREVSAPVAWAFGVGEVAQTYVLKRNGTYLESRVTYYTSLSALDITTGHSSEAPQDMEDTLGDVIDAQTTPRCFGCHTTASSTSGKFDPDHATMGLTCEACHGPGAKHVVAMRGGPTAPVQDAIFAADHLSPVDSVDFCGACHRTPVDVAVEMPADLGIANLRFQPYRLERSHCWGEKGDARITCVACHDPHQPLARGASAYDAKCLACHAAGETVASAKLVAGCKVAKKDCTSCHMPKYKIPAVHAEFTDHYIRIVRPGSGFRP